MTHSIDNFALDCFRQCPKLYYWRIQRGLVKPSDKKVAAEFGTAVHLAMEKWYGGDPSNNIKPMTQEAVDLALTSALEYFIPFENEVDEKRTAARLVAILEKYFTRYPTEPFVPLAVEVGGAFELDNNWTYTTRLDLPVEWKNPSGIYIVDHKTTYDLGSLIGKPHNQMTGYIYNACEMWENVLGVIINGVGVFATDETVDKMAPKVPSPVTGKPIYQKKEREFFIRIPTQRSRQELEEWKSETLFNLHLIEACVERGMWPKNAPDCCVKYRGRCAYLDLCNADVDTAERMVEAGLYEKRVWEAFKGASLDTE